MTRGEQALREAIAHVHTRLAPVLQGVPGPPELRVLALVAITGELTAALVRERPDLAEGVWRAYSLALRHSFPLGDPTEPVSPTTRAH